MFRSLTILQKGILIVSIPVLGQGLFIGILLRSMSETAAAQRWAVHTKEVIAKIEETYRLLLGGYAGVRNLIVLQTPMEHDPFIRDLDRVPESFDQLRALVADNRQQQARIGALIANAGGFTRLLRGIETSVKKGERARALDGLDLAARALREVRSDVDSVLNEEMRLDQDRVARMDRSNAWHFTMLISGGALTLGLTLSLALFFFNSVVRRLEILRENSRRVAQGETLKPPLSGGDELALLDRDFRLMAASLADQKQENEMFVYSVSHDLRSPLINLQGFSEELRQAAQQLQEVFDRADAPAALKEDARKLLDGRMIESIHFIHTAVDRLARIIDSLLRLSRAGRVRYEQQVLDLRDRAESRRCTPRFDNREKRGRHDSSLAPCLG